MADINVLWYIFFIEAAITIILGIIGLFLLLMRQDKKPSDIMLAHLTICNILNVGNMVAMVITTLAGVRSTMWIFSLSGFLLYLPHPLTLVVITIDRILAIKLVLRYRMVVTNKILTVGLVCVWLLAVAYAVPSYFVKMMYSHIMPLCLSAANVIFFIVSYTYIIVKVHFMRKSLSKTGQRNNHSRFNYSVPLIIVLTYILFAVTTDITLLFIGVMNVTPWHFIGWTLNSLADTLTYVLSSPQIRSKIKIGKREQSSMRDGAKHNGELQEESENRIKMAVIHGSNVVASSS